MTRVKTSIPPNTPTPIGPYSHIAMVGELITIGGTAASIRQRDNSLGPIPTCKPNEFSIRSKSCSSRSIRTSLTSCT